MIGMINQIFKMKPKPAPNIYKQAQRFADVTNALLLRGNINRASRCFLKAEEIFNLGTSEIKNAISNVYVYSVSSYLEINKYSIKDMFPQSLQKEYFKQINSTGI